MEDRWLSVEEIAIYLGIKKDTVYTWINERRMPAHKVGRLWKFKRNEIDKWVKAGTHEKFLGSSANKNHDNSLNEAQDGTA